MNLLVLFLVLVVAWLTAAATAVRTVSRIWLRHWVERKLAGSASAEVFLERPQRLLLAAGTVIAGLTFTIGLVASSQARRRRRWRVRWPWPCCCCWSLASCCRGPSRVAGASPWCRCSCRPCTAWAWSFPRCSGWPNVPRENVARSAPLAPEDPREALEDLLREGELEGVGEAERAPSSAAWPSSVPRGCATS